MNPLGTADEFLNPNTFKDGAHYDSKSANWSDNGRYFVYATTKKGSDWHQAYIKDSQTMKDLGEELNWIKNPTFDFTKDDKGFFYLRLPVPQ